MQVSATGDGVELYFPPFRGLATAFALGVFGVIAAALGTIGAIALMPSALAHTGGLMSAVLLATFVLPFAAFGIIFVLIAVYMAFNALHVTVSRDRILAERSLLAITFQRRTITAAEIASIEPQIATRDQNPLNSQPIYRLVAIDKSRLRRVIVAESLTGEELMNRVKAIIERALHGTG